MQRKERVLEENDIVICTVTKIQHHSVFCNLDEFPGKSGMLHISEVSAGRVRNIGEYVKEGKTVICKILKIDEAKGYIDLSLRRVTEAQKKAKAQSIKKYQTASKMVEAAALEAKLKPEDMWEELDTNKGDYETVFDMFQAVVEINYSLPLTGIAKDALVKVITDRLKPVSVDIKGQLEIVTYEPDGVEKIREAFSKTTKLQASYLGGGKYSIHVTAKDYKKAELMLKTDLDSLSKSLEKKATKFAFVRTDR